MNKDKFNLLISALKKLTDQYTTGAIKHYQYADQYDRILEQYAISKEELVNFLNQSV